MNEYKKYFNTNTQFTGLNGPFIKDDRIYWYLNSKLHRLDGPAIDRYSGTKEWWINDKRCRLDGPAIEYANGRKVWIISINKSYNLFYGLINNIENLLDYFIGEE